MEIWASGQQAPIISLPLRPKRLLEAMQAIQEANPWKCKAQEQAFPSMIERGELQADGSSTLIAQGQQEQKPCASGPPMIKSLSPRLATSRWAATLYNRASTGRQ